MALSGSNSTSFANYFRLRLVWSASQSIPNNSSTVTATLYLDSTSGYGAISDATNSSASITINGNTKSWSVQSDVSANGSKNLGSHSVTIGHNADGSKTFSLSASHNIDITWSGNYIGTKSVSGSHTLNSIARASSVSLNKSSVNYGDVVRVTISRASSSFTHTVRYDWNNSKGTIWSKIGWTQGDWTVPLSLMNNIPNATSSWGTISVDTYNGNTLIGTKTVKLTTNVPSNITPGVSTLVASETNPQVSNNVSLGANTYLQGVSNITFEMGGVTTKYGATISKRELIFDNQTKSGTSALFTAIKKAGTTTVTARVTDSRGRTASRNLGVTIVPYSNPTISTFTTNRSDSGTGTQIMVDRKGTISSVSGKNSVTVIIQSREKGTTTWGNTVIANSGIGVTTWGSVVTIPGTYTTSKAYEVRVQASDLFNTVTAQNDIGTGLATMSWGRDGVAIGRVYSGSATLEVGGGIRLMDTIWAGSSGEGYGGIDLNNSDITGANAVWMNDLSQTDNAEGFMFLKTGKPSGSRTKSDYDNFFMRDGRAYFNGITSGDLLWQGASYLHESAVIRPSKDIADCPNGWAMLWSDYDVNGAENNFDYNWTFIPKTHNKGGTIRTPVGYAGDSTINKVYYISGGVISGHPDSNVAGGQRDVVLREVRAF